MFKQINYDKTRRLHSNCGRVYSFFAYFDEAKEYVSFILGDINLAVIKKNCIYYQSHCIQVFCLKSLIWILNCLLFVILVYENYIPQILYSCFNFCYILFFNFQ